MRFVLLDILGVFLSFTGSFGVIIPYDVSGALVEQAHAPEPLTAPLKVTNPQFAHVLEVANTFRLLPQGPAIRAQLRAQLVPTQPLCAGTRAVVSACPATVPDPLETFGGTTVLTQPPLPITIDLQQHLRGGYRGLPELRGCVRSPATSAMCLQLLRFM